MVDKLKRPAPPGSGTYIEFDGTGTSIVYVSPSSGDTNQITINAALDKCEAAGGGIVRLIEGTYNINDTILVPSNCTLEGVGWSTKIFLVDDSNYNCIMNKNAQTTYTLGSTIDENVTIRNLSVDWNIYGNEPVMGVEVRPEEYMTQDLSQAVKINSCNGFLLENLYVKNGGYLNISTSFASNGIIERCTSTWSGAGGIGLLSGSDNIIVKNCTVLQAGYIERIYFKEGDAELSDGDTVTTIRGGGEDETTATIGVVVKEDGEWGGTAQGYFTITEMFRLFADDDQIISTSGAPSGSVVKDADSLAVLASGDWADYRVTGSSIKAQDEVSNIIVADNYVDGSIYRGIASYAHAAYGDNTNISFTGNTVKNCPFAIVLAATDGYLVQGNYCDGTASEDGGGTLTFQGTDRTTQNGTITANTFSVQHPMQYNVYISYPGIVVSNMQITNNVFRSNSLTSSTHYEILIALATIDGILIADNISENTNVAFVRISSSATSIDSMRVVDNLVMGLDRIGRICRVIGFPESGPTYTNCSAGNNTFSGTSPTLQEYNNLDDVEAVLPNDGVDTLPDGWVSLDSEPMLRTITLSRLLTSGDETVLLDGTSVAVTATLPPSPTIRKTYTIKSIVSAGNQTDVSGGVNLIDGVALVVLAEDESKNFQWDGTEWRVL
jgi:hypothetical protein